MSDPDILLTCGNCGHIDSFDCLVLNRTCHSSLEIDVGSDSENDVGSGHASGATGDADVAGVVIHGSSTASGSPQPHPIVRAVLISLVEFDVHGFDP